MRIHTIGSRGTNGQVKPEKRAKENAIDQYLHTLTKNILFIYRLKSRVMSDWRA